MIITLRAKQVEVTAVKWDGSLEAFHEIIEFVGESEIGSSLLKVGRVSCDPPGYWEWELYGEDSLEVWNYLEKQWIKVPLGHYVLKGLKNEFYPCEKEALLMKYDVV